MRNRKRQNRKKTDKGEPGITNSTEDKIECNFPVQMERKNNKDLQSEIKDDSAIKAFKDGELLSGIYSDLHLALLKSYQLKTDIDLVSSLVTDTDGKMWFTNRFHLMFINENEKVEMFKTLEDIEDLAAMKTGALLVSFRNKHNINIISQEGKMKLFYNLPKSQTNISALHVCRDGRIIILFMEPLSTQNIFPLGKTIYHMIVLENSGKCVKTMKCDERYMWNPNLNQIRISENVNNDICISYSVYHNYLFGEIVALDAEGHVRWIYRGCRDLEKNRPFSPCDIATTSHGHIITSDFYTNIIYILNIDGKLLSYKHSRELGIRSPFCLFINKEDHLLAGSCDKLYILNFIQGL